MIEEFPTLTVTPTDDTIVSQVRLEEDELDAQSITMIGGTDWDVEYFKNSTTSNDTLSLPDPDLPETEQQYIRYHIPLRVTSPLSGSTSSDITGTASTAFFKPNVNDVFVAKILGGEEAIFKVDRVTRKSMYLRDVYEIEYSIFMLTSSDITMHPMLIERSVDEYTFNRNREYLTSKPLLKNNELKTYEDLDTLYQMIDKDYNTLFYSKRDMFLLTYEDEVYFDPLLNTLYYYIVGGKCNQFNNHIEYFDNTIIHALIKRSDLMMLNMTNPMYKGYNFEYYDGELYMRKLGNNLTYDIDYAMSTDGDINLINETETLPIDDTFYLMNDIGRDGATKIEFLVNSYMNSGEVQKETLLELAKEYFQYQTFEKYKYGIIILMLIKYVKSEE